MKPHPELTTDEVIQAFRSQKSIRRHQPRDEGDPFDRTPDQAELEEAARFQEWLATHGDDVFRTVCIGCGQDTAIKDATPCACGSFVCHRCRESEEEGVCDHEPPEGV